MKEFNNVPTIIKTGEPGRGISTGKGISLGITVNMMAVKEETVTMGGNMTRVEAGEDIKALPFNF